MKTLGFAVAVAGTLIAGVGLAGAAGAVPTGGGNAADTVRELRAEGYDVQTNGSRTDPLSQCITTAVHGATDPGSVFKQHSFATVYVDVSCPDAH